jgi:hypothetical protein
LSGELRAIGEGGSDLLPRDAHKTRKSVFRRRSIVRGLACKRAESIRRFARERGRNAPERDELDQHWLTALRLGAAAERTHSKARRVRQDSHPKTYSCTSSGAKDAEIARKGMGSTVAPNRSADNTQATPTSPQLTKNEKSKKGVHKRTKIWYNIWCDDKSLDSR